MNLKKYCQYLDWWLIAAVVAVSIFGIIVIGSATHINLGESKSLYYSQMVWFAIGLVIMFLMTKINLEFFSGITTPIYILNVLLLIAVLFIGSSAKGATRWIYFGPLGIQPSEFSKIIIIFCLAKVIDKNKDEINNKIVLLKIFIYVMIPIMLIKKQPSLSASLVLLIIFITELFVSGVRYKYIFTVLLIFIPIVAFIVFDVTRTNHIIVNKVLNDYQISRIATFIHPVRGSDEYYQTLKSISAIGSGQFMGKGLYQGTLNQLSYLPEPHNDFIFSVIGEEFGFIGCIAVLALLFFIIFRCSLIAMSSRDKFSQLIVSGIIGMFAFQTFVNTGVATGILPNTGMSLPFVGYGGSSMWTNMAAIGMVLNVGLKRSKSLFEEV
ncbi:MAG: rod shape-determining protein RodA [Clostridia bacterium]|jgi:rod shape determining protein RodA|nr:rod shape-determining protein RodA [Clostridia bacterium]MCI1999947.1 rod shape-determining protein RodA [Clostridia bacterium]MCI2014519.1 rod shape-determining protein RodA [Clostridia bacterium]